MIVLLIISILVLFLVERWSIRHGLDRITYDVVPSQTLLEPDEEFTVRSTIENHKLWFVPYVSMVENFPSGIQIPPRRRAFPPERSTPTSMSAPTPAPIRNWPAAS